MFMQNFFKKKARMNIGERIRLLRGNETRKSFAEKIGIHQQTLYIYEKGKRDPDRETIEKICLNLKINVNWLIFGKEPKYTEEVYTPEEHTLTLCRHCQTLENKLQEMEQERKEKDKELREIIIENRQLWKENAKLREELAILRERREWITRGGTSTGSSSLTG